MEERYKKQIALKEVGPEGQKKINNTAVLVVGAGGLGCPVLQYLTAAGVGRIGIIDPDIVSISNLHRQILYGQTTIGLNKAVAAKAMLRNLNPQIHIQAYQEPLNYSNALDLIAKYDIVVDCTDNFATRYLINDACVIAGKPWVYAALHKFEGQVAVFNYKQGPTYRCMFPEIPKNIPDCDETGILGVLPGIIGTLQANEILKLILGIGTPLSGKMLYFNALTHEFRTVNIRRDNEAIQSILKEKDNFSERLWQPVCATETVSGLAAKSAITIQNAVFIDVRQPGETPPINKQEILKIPLDTIDSKVNGFKKDKNYVFICRSGRRAKIAAGILRKHGLNAYFINSSIPETIEVFVKQKEDSPVKTHQE